MSNSLAIASVTATLRRLLEKGGIEHVTVRPLDKAPEGINADKQRINLFLYQALPDAAFRNMEMPGRVKSFSFPVTTVSPCFLAVAAM